MDPEIREKLQILLQKKADAVEREDFDEAMQFKEISDKLKMIGSDLSLFFFMARHRCLMTESSIHEQQNIRQR